MLIYITVDVGMKLVRDDETNWCLGALSGPLEASSVSTIPLSFEYPKGFDGAQGRSYRLLPFLGEVVDSLAAEPHENQWNEPSAK